MAANLKKSGWQYIVVDIRWFVENDKAGGYNQTDPRYVIDDNGRYQPAGIVHYHQLHIVDLFDCSLLPYRFLQTSECPQRYIAIRFFLNLRPYRSEERRVGKKFGFRWSCCEST